MKENKKFSDFKGSNVHELSNEAFIPVITPDENFKINVTELSTEELHAVGDNIRINNEHKIIATNTELIPGDHISIENDIISYSGPKGTTRTITPAKYSVPGEELQNIEINDNKIDLILTFGEEAREEHPHVSSHLATGSYFKYKDGSLVLEPHFAGFNNRMLFFNENLGNLCHSLNKPELFNLHIDKSGIYLHTGNFVDKKYYLIKDSSDNIIIDETGVDITHNPPENVLNITPYSQIIYNLETTEEDYQLNTIFMHSDWLKQIAHKEITLTQLNKSIKTSASRNKNPSCIAIYNDDSNINHIANYYFYHNGKLYKKENIIGNVAVVIYLNVDNDGIYTDLSGEDVNIYTGAISMYLQSFPFASRIDVIISTYNWIVNTVNRFYCITEYVNENETNYYIIESMY